MITNDNEWYKEDGSERQRVAVNDNELQRVTGSSKINENGTIHIEE